MRLTGTQLRIHIIRIPTVSHPQRLIQPFHEVDGGFRDPVRRSRGGDRGVILDHPEGVARAVGGWCCGEGVIDARGRTAEEVEFGEPARGGGAVGGDVGEEVQEGGGLPNEGRVRIFFFFLEKKEGEWRFCTYGQGGRFRDEDALGVEVVVGVVAG